MNRLRYGALVGLAALGIDTAVEVVEAIKDKLGNDLSRDVQIGYEFNVDTMKTDVFVID